MSNVEEAKSAVGIFDFVGGYLMKEKTGDEEIVHCLKKFRVRELSGYEEDIILNDSIPMNERYYAVMGRCLEEVRDDDGHVIIDPKILLAVSDDLVISDIMILLFRIFQTTMGNELIVPVKCDKPGCGNSQNEFVKLDSLKIVPIAGDPKIRVRQFTTSRGNVITWEMMTGKTDRNVNRVVEKKDSRATAVFMRRVRTINGEPVTIEKLKSLPMKERQEIRKKFDEEGGVETTLQTVCRKCGEEFSFELEMGHFSFFRQQEG